MDKNAKIFCRGSKELKEVVEELEAERKIPAQSCTFNDPYGLFIPDKNGLEYFSKDLIENLVKKGYSEVTPSAIKEYFDPTSVPSKHLCYSGSFCLSAYIDMMLEEYKFVRRANGHCEFCYTFRKEEDDNWAFVKSSGCTKAKSLQEFIDYWKQILPKKKQESKKETTKEYVGFRGGPEVKRELLPLGLEIVDSYNMKGPEFLFYFKRETDKDGKLYNTLRRCINGSLRSEEVEIISFKDFCERVSLQIMVDNLPGPTLMTAKDVHLAVSNCLVSEMPLTPEETTQPSLKLPEKKSLKIIL